MSINLSLLASKHIRSLLTSRTGASPSISTALPQPLAETVSLPSIPARDVSQSVDLGWNNNPNTTPTKDYENVRVVVYLCGVQRGCAEEGERGSTPTG